MELQQKLEEAIAIIRAIDDNASFDEISLIATNIGFEAGLSQSPQNTLRCMRELYGGSTPEFIMRTTRMLILFSMGDSDFFSDLCTNTILLKCSLDALLKNKDDSIKADDQWPPAYL